MMFVSTFLSLFGIVGVLLYIYFKKNERYFRLGHQLPGPPYWELLKTYPASMKSPAHIFHTALTVTKGYDKVIKFWFGYQLYVILVNPKDVEVILSSNVHLEKSQEYKLFKPWFGNGLLISKGETWKQHRKMIAPTFHMSILKSFMPTFNKISTELCKKLQKEIGKPFDCHEYLSGVTVDILLETVMGFKEPRKEETGYEYAVAVMKLCNILHQRSYKLWLRYDTTFSHFTMSKEHDQLLNLIQSLCEKAASSRKAEHLAKKKSGVTEAVMSHQPQDTCGKTNGAPRISGYNAGTAVRDDLDENDENDVGEKKRQAFLDSLTEASLKDGTNFTEADVIDQVNTIMFEGHDTTAAGSSFVLCMLGIYQKVQEKVVLELKDIFGDSDRPCSYADTLEMKYLERVIMETLRIYPPVPVIARKINEEVKLASGDYILPIGSTAVISPFLLHRNPRSFSNPNEFNPDNFLPEKCQERHYYSYVPFSAGPRSCVGRKYAMLKLKVVLSTILRSFEIASDVTEKDFVLQGDIILKLTNGFMIKIEKRGLN